MPSLWAWAECAPGNSRPHGGALCTLEPECCSWASLVATRSLPKHERLVDLHGSVIDYNYGGGSSIAVLLIMERLHRDLYTGLKVRWGKGPRRSQQPDPQAPLWPVILSCLSRPSSFHKTVLEKIKPYYSTFQKNLKNFSESIFSSSLHPEYCQFITYTNSCGGSKNLDYSEEQK